MATIGLRVQDASDGGASLSLADTLAKGIFGDPEAQMKARALAAQVQAHQAYAGNLNEKTKEDQTAEAERLRAGPLVGDAAAAAVPMPVPVEAPNPPVAGPEGWGAIGATHPVPVSQHDWDVHNTLVARERALGPILVRGTPTQVAEGVGKDYGGTILAAGASNPAIVSGDSLRIAGGLYTGTAPTTSTVWGAGDTSGVDAAAREKILEDRAKPPEPKTYTDQPYTTVVGPDGQPRLIPTPGFVPSTTQDAPKTMTDAAGHNLQWDPVGKTWIPAPGAADAAPAEPKVIEMSPDKTPMIWDDKTQKYIPAPGAPTAGPQDGSTYAGDKSVAGQQNRIIESISQTFSDPKAPITPNQAIAYGQAHTGLYGVKTTFEKDNLGNIVPVQVYVPSPPDAPSINDVRLRAGLPPLGPTTAANPPAPVASGPAPAGPAPAPTPDLTPAPIPGPAPAPGPAPTSNVAVLPTIAGPPKPPTQEQTQLQQYTPQLVASTQKIDKLTPQQVPSLFVQQILGVRGNDPSFIQSALASTNFVSPQQRNFAQAVAEYNQSLLYMLSGKAITSDEYKRALLSYIPQPGDGPEQLATKTAERHRIIASAVRLGWSNDPQGAKAKVDEIKTKNGIDLANIDQPAPKRRVYDANGNLQ